MRVAHRREQIDETDPLVLLETLELGLDGGGMEWCGTWWGGGGTKRGGEGWDGVGWDGAGWDAVGREGVGQDGMGWGAGRRTCGRMAWHEKKPGL